MPVQMPKPVQTPMPVQMPMPVQTPKPVQTPMPVQMPQAAQTSMPIQQQNIDNIYINIQDYLNVLNLLHDKTKDSFISVDTILTNMKPYLYKKVEKNR
jgi:hypothetical protein